MHKVFYKYASKMHLSVHTIEYHPIQQTPNIRHTREFVRGSFWNSILQPDQGGHALGMSSSLHKRNPRTATFIKKVMLVSPTPPAGSRGDDEVPEPNKEQATRIATRRVTGSPASEAATDRA
jgi:hypothetical protein